MFKPSFWQLYLFLCPVTLWVFSAVILTLEGRKLDLISYLTAAVSTFFVTAVEARILHCYIAVGISPEGISGHSIWGIRRFIRWDEIAKVRSFTILNLRSARLFSSTDGKVTWISLFPEEPEGFRRAVAEVMPLGCPLAQSIE